MGKGARVRGQRAAKIAGKALNAALRERDEDAAVIADAVYQTAREQRRTSVQSGAALWVVTGTAFLAEQAASRLAGERGLDEKTAGLLAAYINQGLMETLKALVVDFDPEHFEEWARAFGEEARMAAAEAATTT